MSEKSTCALCGQPIVWASRFGHLIPLAADPEGAYGIVAGNAICASDVLWKFYGGTRYSAHAATCEVLQKERNSSN